MNDSKLFQSFNQALLQYFTPQQLTAIQKTSIGIAGAGGLGSNCAQMLVRSGFCKFLIADFDWVETSNLNRQFYFRKQIGLSKVGALQENLISINPDIQLEMLQKRVDQSNVTKLFAGCDVIVEAFDQPDCKKMLIEAYLSSGKLVVAASGLAGWGASDRIKVHKMKENFFIVGDLVTGITDQSPFAPCVQIAAAKQADIILEYILGPMKG